MVAAPGKIEVLGVVVKKGNKNISIKARKGVILSCGGFDYNESMKKNFLAAYPNYSVGHQGNTGDAIKLASKTGAESSACDRNIRNIVLQVPRCSCGLSFPAADVCNRPLVIFVSKYGDRFCNEAVGSYDLVCKALYNYDPVKRDFANIPCWSIFDEKARVKGPAGLPIPIGKPTYTGALITVRKSIKGGS